MRRRGADGIDTKFADRLDQGSSLAHAEGDNGRPGGLQVLMVGVAAHPETIIEAVNHRIARTQARRPEAASGAFIHQVAILASQSNIERPTGRARGFMNANELLWRTDQIAAEGRMLLLTKPTLVLLSEREQGQIGHISNAFALDARLGEFALIEGGREPDIIKLSPQGLMLQPTQCCRLDSFYSFIPVHSLHSLSSHGLLAG